LNTESQPKKTFAEAGVKNLSGKNSDEILFTLATTVQLECLAMFGLVKA
jgi:hypothetical protein